MRCTATKHKLRDQVTSENEENSNKKTMHLIISSSFLSPFIFTICVAFFTADTSSRKGLQTNDASIWIVNDVFSVGIFFHFPPCTICVNTEIFKATMATVFEHFKLIAVTIVPDLNIMNHASLYFIETLGMHSQLAITYPAIQPPYAAVNYFFH